MAKLFSGSGTTRIEGISTPTADTDAANKKYVDDHTAELGLDANNSWAALDGSNGLSTNFTYESDLLDSLTDGQFHITSQSDGSHKFLCRVDDAVSLQNSSKFLRANDGTNDGFYHIIDFINDGASNAPFEINISSVISGTDVFDSISDGDTFTVYVSDSSSELKRIADVNISSVSNGQVLSWDNDNSQWVNADAAAGSLSGLSDTTISSPSSEQVLMWDAADNRWENTSVTNNFLLTRGTFTTVSSWTHDNNADIFAVAGNGKYKRISNSGTTYRIELSANNSSGTEVLTRAVLQDIYHVIVELQDGTNTGQYKVLTENQVDDHTDYVDFQYISGSGTDIFASNATPATLTLLRDTDPLFGIVDDNDAGLIPKLPDTLNNSEQYVFDGDGRWRLDGAGIQLTSGGAFYHPANSTDQYTQISLGDGLDGNITGTTLTLSVSGSYDDDDADDRIETYIDVNKASNYTAPSASSGDNNVAIGHNASATGSGAFAVGDGADASGSSGLAIGDGAIASSFHSAAIGIDAQSQGGHSIVLGDSHATVRKHEDVAGTEHHDNELASKKYVDDRVSDSYVVVKGDGINSIGIQGTDNDVPRVTFDNDSTNKGFTRKSPNSNQAAGTVTHWLFDFDANDYTNGADAIVAADHFETATTGTIEGETYTVLKYTGPDGGNIDPEFDGFQIDVEIPEESGSNDVYSASYQVYVHLLSGETQVTASNFGGGSTLAKSDVVYIENQQGDSGRQKTLTMSAGSQRTLKEGDFIYFTIREFLSTQLLAASKDHAVTLTSASDNTNDYMQFNLNTPDITAQLFVSDVSGGTNGDLIYHKLDGTATTVISQLTGELAADVISDDFIVERMVGNDAIGIDELKAATNSTPANDAGKVLTANSSGTGLEWGTPVYAPSYPATPASTTKYELQIDTSGNRTWVAASGVGAGAGIEEYSATETYTNGDVVHWAGENTDSFLYRWVSSTDSVAGTDPSESDDWVVIGLLESENTAADADSLASTVTIARDDTTNAWEVAVDVSTLMQLNYAPTNADHIANKRYVDDEAVVNAIVDTNSSSTVLGVDLDIAEDAVNGGTLSATVQPRMGTGYTPSDNLDLTTKTYVDTQVSGVSVPDVPDHPDGPDSGSATYVLSVDSSDNDSWAEVTIPDTPSAPDAPDSGNDQYVLQVASDDTKTWASFSSLADTYIKVDASDSSPTAANIGDADDAIAIGAGASVVASGANPPDADRAIAIGHDAAATQSDSVAIGFFSSATTQKAIAIGEGADASHNNSAAIGPFAATTSNNEMMLGGHDNASPNVFQVVKLSRQTASSDSDDAVATKKYVDDVSDDHQFRITDGTDTQRIAEADYSNDHVVLPRDAFLSAYTNGKIKHVYDNGGNRIFIHDGGTGTRIAVGDTIGDTLGQTTGTWVINAASGSDTVQITINLDDVASEAAVQENSEDSDVGWILQSSEYSFSSGSGIVGFPSVSSMELSEEDMDLVSTDSLEQDIRDVQSFLKVTLESDRFTKTFDYNSDGDIIGVQYDSDTDTAADDYYKEFNYIAAGNTNAGEIGDIKYFSGSKDDSGTLVLTETFTYTSDGNVNTITPS